MYIIKIFLSILIIILIGGCKNHRITIEDMCSGDHCDPFYIAGVLIKNEN